MPRTILVHLNVLMPDDILADAMTADDVATGLILPSLEVGMEGSPFVLGLDDGKRFEIVVALAEEI